MVLCVNQMCIQFVFNNIKNKLNNQIEWNLPIPYIRCPADTIYRKLCMQSNWCNVHLIYIGIDASETWTWKMTHRLSPFYIEPHNPIQFNIQVRMPQDFLLFAWWWSCSVFHWNLFSLVRSESMGTVMEIIVIVKMKVVVFEKMVIVMVVMMGFAIFHHHQFWFNDDSTKPNAAGFFFTKEHIFQNQ